MEPSTSRLPEVDVAGVARRLLIKRARRLLREMRGCARASGDAESVHQLRVATRRFDAVLRFCAPLYSRRQLKRIRKQVRCLRQAARQVRDLDVLLDRLPPLQVSTPDLSALTAELRFRRHDAADDLHRVLRKRRRKRLQARLKRLRTLSIADAGSAEHPGIESAGTLLGPCIAAFQSAAEADLADTAALHRFRLQGKRLRYTLELLPSRGEHSGAAALMALLKNLQEQLGEVNDHASAAEVLRALVDVSVDARVRSVAQQLAEQELRSLEQEKAGFLNWWTADGAEQVRTALDFVQKALVPDAAD